MAAQHGQHAVQQLDDPAVVRGLPSPQLIVALQLLSESVPPGSVKVATATRPVSAPLDRD